MCASVCVCVCVLRGSVLRGSVSDCILPVGCYVFMCSYEYREGLGGGGEVKVAFHS